MTLFLLTVNALVKQLHDMLWQERTKCMDVTGWLGTPGFMWVNTDCVLFLVRDALTIQLEPKTRFSGTTASETNPAILTIRHVRTELSQSNLVLYTRRHYGYAPTQPTFL